MGKYCARSLEYVPRPKAEGHNQDQGHSFFHMDRPSLVNNIFIFFWGGGGCRFFEVGKQFIGVIWFKVSSSR